MGIPKHVNVKTDEQELIELANFFKSSVKGISVKREWFIVFDESGKFMRAQPWQPKHLPSMQTYRHPDLMIFPEIYRKTNKAAIYEKPLVVYELDGSIHDVKLADTLKRNDVYKKAEVPLVVTNKKSITISIFDDAYKKIMENL